MEIIQSIESLKQKIREIKKGGKSIGFVPTMGALHAGHRSLMDYSVQENNYTVLSIFVNPIQFGPNEDFDRYPRTPEEDYRIAESAGVDLVFTPVKDEITSQDLLAFVDIRKLQDNLCGEKRPGHFQGVCTIVAKLFNLVEPDRAYFGKKDLQQYLIIDKMVHDLNFNVKVVGCPIVRETDGLAMSSRNRYLTQDERSQAVILSKSLQEAQSLFNNGEKSASFILKTVHDSIRSKPLAVIDYIKTVNRQMEEIQSIQKGDILALAVYFGKTRLIDNIIFGE